MMYFFMTYFSVIFETFDPRYCVVFWGFFLDAGTYAKPMKYQIKNSKILMRGGVPKLLAVQEGSSSSSSAAADQYFNQVSLLLHGEALADSSRFNRSVSAANSAAVSSTQNKFGTGGLYFPAATGYPSYATGVFNIGTTAGGFNIYGDYVIEWWQYLSDTTRQEYIFSGGIVGTGETLFSMDWNWSAGTFRPTYNIGVLISHGGSLIANQWQYIAVSRAGKTIRLYVDGVLKGSADDEIALRANGLSAQLGYGGLSSAISNGYIDDLRITNGINRGYIDSTIAVPTAAFPDTQASGAFAVILTGGTSFTIPSGYTSMKAWAVGQGACDSSYTTFPSGAGGCAYKTWSVTGGSTVTYSVGNSRTTAGGNTTVTYGGTTITGNGADGTTHAGGGFSGGDGGANGGVGFQGYNDFTGGAIGGTAGTTASGGLRRLPTDISGLFAAVTLAGGQTTATNGSAPFGAGGFEDLKDGGAISAGFGGGRVLSVTETPGAVVLSFT